MEMRRGEERREALEGRVFIGLVCKAETPRKASVGQIVSPWLCGGRSYAQTDMAVRGGGVG